MDDIVPGVRDALDIGAGTGIVGRLLRLRGVDVIGVEPDERMAAIARDSGITTEIASFESWEPAGRMFDLVTCGQAWHWVDPAVGPAKVASLLRPGGTFAAFWNQARYPDTVTAAFTPIYQRLAPHLLVDSVALGTREPWGDDDARLLEEANVFADVTQRRYSWTRRCSVSEWIDELPTHSGHRALQQPLRLQLLAEVRAAVSDVADDFDVDYTTNAVLARARTAAI